MKVHTLPSLVAISLALIVPGAFAQDPVPIPDGIAGPIDAGQDRGFRVISVQAPELDPDDPDLEPLPRTVPRAIQQYNGTLRDNNGQLVPNEAIKGPNADGSFSADVVNFEQNADPEVADMTLQPGDVLFPGIPGTEGHTTEFVTEAIAYIELTAGNHTFGVEVFNARVDAPFGGNDDIAVIYTGTNPRDYFATKLGEWQRDGDPFASVPQGSDYEFIAPVAGLYPFRFLYLNRSGGSTLALYESGNEELLNDDDSGVVVFQNSTDSKHGHAYIAEVRPVPGSAGVQSNIPVEIWIADDETTVAVDAVTLTFNGSDVTGQADILKSDGKIMVDYQAPQARPSGDDDIVLSYTDSAGTTHTQAWFFTSVQGDPEPKVAGQWDFTAGLDATFGPDLTYRDGPNGITADGTKFGTTASFGDDGINGEVADVMLVPGDADWDVGYCLEHGIAPNGGGSLVNQYTLLMDVQKIGEGGASAIIQTRMNDKSDASFFWQGANMGQGGGGYEGFGTFLPDEWHRIGFAVDLAADPPRITKWVDGELQQEPYWQQQSLDQARRALDPIVYFFNDGDERSEWYVNSIQLWDGFLPNEFIEALGGPTADGFEGPTAGGLQFTGISVAEDGDVTITWNSRPNRSYRIDRAPDLQGWIELTDGYPSQGDSTSFTDTDTEGASGLDYRVTEE